MLKSLFKLLRFSPFVLILMVVSCKQEVTKEDVRQAIEESHFTINGSADISSDQVKFNYVLTPGFKSVLTQKDIVITKVEFFFDDELISTSYSEPYKVEGEKTGLSSDMVHTLYAHIYGRTCPENETYFPLTIKEYNLPGIIDCDIDYNLVGEGDTFTISAKLNPEKSDKNVSIKSFSAKWGSYSMGTCTSEPFTLSHVVTDHADEDIDVTAKIELSNGTILNREFEVSVIPANTPYTTVVISPGKKKLTQSDILRLKVKAYTGKGYKGSYSLLMYFDDELIASSKTFPFTYEKPMRNVSKGSHLLKWRWTFIDAAGNEKDGGFTNHNITIE